MTGPSLLITDLDGTLLGRDSQLTAATIKAVHDATDAGLQVIAATGRSFWSAVPKLEAAPIRWVICSNGGLIWDRQTDSVALHRPMSGAIAEETVNTIRAAHPGAGFGWETLGGFGFDDVFVEACSRVDEIGMGEHPGPLRAELEITKLFVCIPGLRRLDLQKAVQANLPDGVNGSASGADFVETTRAGVDKATTAAILVESLGFTASDVVAFGDNLNDVSLLQWAGSSVAMGNAHRNVTSVADQIAPSNLDDGVAFVIHGLLG